MSPEVAMLIRGLLITILVLLLEALHKRRCERP